MDGAGKAAIAPRVAMSNIKCHSTCFRYSTAKQQGEEDDQADETNAAKTTRPVVRILRRGEGPCIRESYIEHERASERT